MGGVEVLAVAVVFIVGAVGLVRGASKELGVTMVLVVLLAVFSQFDQLVSTQEMPEKLNSILAGVGLGSDDPLKQRTMVVFLYSAVVVFTAFLAYHGQDTLSYSFREPSGPLGAVLGWIIGALNGYLMAGSVWFFLDELQYPVVRYEWFTLPLTSIGQRWVEFLPQNIASGLVLSGAALGLLWWRILK
jgi:hypothetical protein